ncbi:hypothetical protein [Haloarchaeobius sp. HRN-SO-5]|uniref:hypothetical protein n=1 Tax=Haloarchaeobius sp. HRN-SO-5 TaxID=3446118 RepID=UPI003EC01F2B
MTRQVVPPIVAGIVAIVVGLTRYIVPLVFEFEVFEPSQSMLSVSIAWARFLSFVLVYVVLFGLAYWVGTRQADASTDGPLVLATGGIAAVCYLVTATLVVFLVNAPFEGNALLVAIRTLGASVSVGVQLAVVTFAGVALARRSDVSRHVDGSW